jgi:hypothetical protein
MVWGNLYTEKRQSGLLKQLLFFSSILRSAHQLYSDDDEFRQLSLYVRHNRAQQGHLKLGDRAIDIQLLNMDGKFVSLLSYSHSNRPLLIIGGSYTWPPFRGLVPQLNQLMDVYHGRVDMITIYIEEAHADDEWYITTFSYSMMNAFVL